MRYFKFTLTRGHMGCGNMNGVITFYEQAPNLIKAMDKARAHGGVKHNRIPLNGVEISKAEYDMGRQENAYDRAHCRKNKF